MKTKTVTKTVTKSKTPDAKVLDLYIGLHRRHKIAAAKAGDLKSQLADAEGSVLAEFDRAGVRTITRRGMRLKLAESLSVKAAVGADRVVAALKAAKLSELLAVNWSSLKALVKGRCGDAQACDPTKLPKALREALRIETTRKLSAVQVKG